MRVLTFTTLFPNGSYPNQGVFVRERTRNVAEICNVTVVAPVPASLPLPGRAGQLAAVPREETMFGLTVHHPRYWSIPGGWPRLKARTIASGARATIARLHRDAPFDIIDAHFAHPDGAAAARIAARLKIPFVLSLRGSDIHRDLDRPALRPLILQTAHRADALIAVADPLADRLVDAGIPADKIHVIPNGVDANRFASRDRAEARAAIGADASDPLLLAVGALKRVKGFDVLIDAFATLDGDRATRLWIVGEGPERSSLEARIARHGLSDRVRLVGLVAYDELAAHYAAADGFVLSSRNEGCPNVLLEALSCGCPAVGTRVGHVPALLGEDMLVQPGNAAALSAGLDRLLNTQHDRAAIRASVLDLTWEKVAARVRDVFATTLQGTGKPASERTSACSAEF